MRWLAIVVVLGSSLLLPQLAHAQYKNSAFALDAGYEFITRPPLVDSSGAALTAAHLPLRLGHSFRLGGEIDFKLHADHWWFTGRLNGKLYGYDPARDLAGSFDYQFDSTAQQPIGTILGIEGVLGVRYYFLTDLIRPYLGVGVSYMHLFSFTSVSSSQCTILGSCADTTASVGDNYLPHTNIFSLRLQPGVEFILVRDLALSFQADLQRWLVINAEGNWVFGGLVGVVFYG